MLILFDGPESAGKTTTAKRLVDHLKSGGNHALYVREPGGNAVCEAIRGVLLDPQHKGMEPLTEFFLFIASRAQVLSAVVRPALDAGADVVLDRYSLSTMAYQIAGRGLPLAPCLGALELATKGLVPDRTFLLTCSYETSHARQVAAGKKLDRLEQEGEAFHRRVIYAYEGFARLLPDWNIRHIQTDGLSLDGVFHRVLESFRDDYGVYS
jgi:dTMP kinase